MAFRIGRCLLRDLLHRRGMTQTELADKIGRSPQRIHDYSTNRVKMTLETAATIASVIGCHIDDLYEWKQEPGKLGQKK